MIVIDTHFQQEDQMTVVKGVSVCRSSQEMKDLKTAKGEFLNKGQYGSIHIATNDANLVWKILKKNKHEKVLTEVYAMSRLLGHSHIVQFRCYQTNGLIQGICMERIRGQELFDEINDKTLSVANIHSITHQLASAIAYIHSKGIAHRDIKPENVMIERKGSTHVRAVIIDFGEAKCLDGNKIMHSVVGTPYYIPYEMAMGIPYTSKCDIWSFGITVYVMWFMTYPFTNRADIQYQRYQLDDSTIEKSLKVTRGCLLVHRGEVPQSILTLFKAHLFVTEHNRFDAVQLLAYLNDHDDAMVDEHTKAVEDKTELYSAEEQAVAHCLANWPSYLP